MLKNIKTILYNQALKALKNNDIPVGALIVLNDKIIAKGYNQKEFKNSITSHAEIIAITKASKKLGTWKLQNAILYTTLKPCPICWEAIKHSRIKKVVFFAKNEKVINYKTTLKFKYDKQFSQLIKNFFINLRTK